MNGIYGVCAQAPQNCNFWGQYGETLFVYCLWKIYNSYLNLKCEKMQQLHLFDKQNYEF